MQRSGAECSQSCYKMFFMKKNYSAVFYTLLILLISSCAKTNTIPNQKTEIIVLPPNGPSVINSSNRFAFDFFRATLQKDVESNNKLISPLSIYLALSMVCNGANNATKDSIANTLRLDGIDINSLNSLCHTLISSFPGEDNRVQLSIANSIWYRQNSYKPLSSFLNIVESNYKASINPLNFNDPNSVKTINNWVAQKTNNKISQVIQSISTDDLMYVINAIYFNGAWKYAFNTSNTTKDVFYLQDGSTRSVPFMKQKITTKMFANNAFTLIELPYGGGKSFSMYLLKPTNQQESLKTFALSINEYILKDAINKMDSFSFELQIPKWEYSYELKDMRSELSMLGMGIAFGDGADFSKLYDPQQTSVHISKAIHKAYIKVNEEGTEAAAVTIIGIGVTSFPALPSVLKIDHPFLYTIIEKQTGAVLFLGTVNDPSK
jgi:serine protease inhibitor